MKEHDLNLQFDLANDFEVFADPLRTTLAMLIYDLVGNY
tara:strand:- start:174 stop:290 length:117 start_codon:yes stop_codon:yes gene_type:complete